MVPAVQFILEAASIEMIDNAVRAIGGIGGSGAKGSGDNYSNGGGGAWGGFALILILVIQDPLLFLVRLLAFQALLIHHRLIKDHFKAENGPTIF